MTYENKFGPTLKTLLASKPTSVGYTELGADDNKRFRHEVLSCLEDVRGHSKCGSGWPQSIFDWTVWDWKVPTL